MSKTEVPDYYDSKSHPLLARAPYSPPTVISNPMDLQTMVKKVKQRHYKSKKEFHDDLNLIWDNCFTYNANKVSYPYRQMAKGQCP